MQSLEVRIPAGYNIERVNRIIELLCAEEGLDRKLKSTLKGYPGSTHWHFKKGNEAGTLEVTLWPSNSKIWFSIHDNRKGSWTKTSSSKLAAATRKALNNNTSGKSRSIVK